MDRIEKYRRIIERVLTEYAAIPYAHGEIEKRCAFDRARDEYVLVNAGWDGHRRVSGTIIHLEISGGKIWVQEDNTDYGIATDLEAAGVPKSDIVLGFHPPDVRPYTEYAAN